MTNHHVTFFWLDARRQYGLSEKTVILSVMSSAAMARQPGAINVWCCFSKSCSLHQVQLIHKKDFCCPLYVPNNSPVSISIVSVFDFICHCVIPNAEILSYLIG